MKIAQVSATFPPYMAGTGNVCYHNAIELAKLGHKVTVFTSKYPDEDYKYPDLIKVRRFKPVFRIGNAPFIPQLLSIKDYDIIHLHSPFFFGDAMINLLSKLRGEKYVTTYHNDVIHSNKIIGIFSKVYINTIMKLAIKNAVRIYTSSLDYAGHSTIIKEFIKNREKDIVEISNGVDINRFNTKISCEEIKLLHRLGNKNIILFVGALDKSHSFKGIEYLLKSFAKIRDNGSCLILVGDGDLKNYYMRLSNKLGIADKTLFVGRVSNLELPKYYAASDLLVLPSITMGEAFGLVLIEAMATGKPVIASNLPGVRTVVDDGVNGFLVKPKDVDGLASKIKYLIENKDVRKRFGIEGRKKVEEKYSWKKIAKKLEKSYEEILYENTARAQEVN